MTFRFVFYMPFAILPGLAWCLAEVCWPKTLNLNLYFLISTKEVVFDSILCQLAGRHKTIFWTIMKLARKVGHIAKQLIKFCADQRHNQECDFFNNACQVTGPMVCSIFLEYWWIRLFEWTCDLSTNNYWMSMKLSGRMVSVYHRRNDDTSQLDPTEPGHQSNTIKLLKCNSILKLFDFQVRWHTRTKVCTDMWLSQYHHFIKIDLLFYWYLPGFYPKCTKCKTIPWTHVTDM